MSQHNRQEDGQSGGGNEKDTSTQPMQEILPRLHLGDSKAAENIEVLRSNDISFVLSIKNRELSRNTREAYRMASISHIHISKQDIPREDLLSIFEPVCDMIEARLAKGKAVLVHCAVGKSRSATVIIAYVMRHLNMSCHEAMKFVRSKRPVVNPNLAFHEQLHLWENCGFDLQKRLIIDKQKGFDPVRLSCTVGVKTGKAKGDEAKRKGKMTQEEGEEEEEEETKRCEEDKEMKVVREERESREQEKQANQENEKQKPDNPNGHIAKADAKTEAPQKSEANIATNPASPGGIFAGLSKAFRNLADSIILATDAAPPAPSAAVICAAIRTLYRKYTSMCKKQLLHILNADQGWSIGSEEFRAHFVDVVRWMEPERGGGGD